MAEPRLTRVADVRGFMAQRGQRNVGAHNFTGRVSRCPWPYCTRCGLLLLRNEVTARAAKAACVVEE
jgi:hypothetical protein